MFRPFETISITTKKSLAFFCTEVEFFTIMTHYYSQPEHSVKYVFCVCLHLFSIVEVLWCHSTSVC